MELTWCVMCEYGSLRNAAAMRWSTSSPLGCEEAVGWLCGREEWRIKAFRARVSDEQCTEQHQHGKPRCECGNVAYHHGWAPSLGSDQRP